MMGVMLGLSLGRVDDRIIPPDVLFSGARVKVFLSTTPFYGGFLYFPAWELFIG
jgi:hypothetical protein